MSRHDLLFQTATQDSISSSESLHYASEIVQRDRFTFVKKLFSLKSDTDNKDTVDLRGTNTTTNKLWGKTITKIMKWKEEHRDYMS